MSLGPLFLSLSGRFSAVSNGLIPRADGPVFSSHSRPGLGQPGYGHPPQHSPGSVVLSVARFGRARFSQGVGDLPG